MSDVTTANGRYPQRCQGTTRSGEPWQAWAIEGSNYCFWHAPSAAAERRQAEARGLTVSQLVREALRHYVTDAAYRERTPQGSDG